MNIFNSIIYFIVLCFLMIIPLTVGIYTVLIMLIHNKYSKRKKDISKEEFDKKDGIYIVSEIEGVDSKDIYTIGNASNDKGMLLEFNGYKMPYSYPEILFSRAKLTSSVKTLIRKIERRNHE